MKFGNFAEQTCLPTLNGGLQVPTTSATFYSFNKHIRLDGGPRQTLVRTHHKQAN